MIASRSLAEVGHGISLGASLCAPSFLSPFPSSLQGPGGPLPLLSWASQEPQALSLQGSLGQAELGWEGSSQPTSFSASLASLGASGVGILAWRTHHPQEGCGGMRGATKGRVSPFTSPQPDLKDQPMASQLVGAGRGAC